jgi:gentisate 1,2-dioxygenase
MTDVCLSDAATLPAGTSLRMNEPAKRIKTLQEFDVALQAAHLLGQWKFEPALQRAKDGPKSYGVPHLWRWDVVEPMLMEACAVLPKSNEARRNLSFRNPATNGGAATHSVSVGMQAVVPGETCWAHRHSIDALRFSIVGNPQLFTVVNGEPLAMETGDLVLTPAYTWHDHHNESDEVGIWLDVLNTPMMFALNQIFFEEFGEERQPVRPSVSDALSVRGGMLRPAWEQSPSVAMPFRYPWRDVLAALQEFSGSAGSPFDGVLLRYANPFTGGPTLPTLDAYIQMLRPGLRTQQHRQSSSAVYYVIEGEGTAVVGDHELHWTTGDTFCIPNWVNHHHVNRSANQRALLFVVSDSPTLKALGLYREEPQSTLQTLPPPMVPADSVRRDLSSFGVR